MFLTESAITPKKKVTSEQLTRVILEGQIFLMEMENDILSMKNEVMIKEHQSIINEDVNILNESVGSFINGLIERIKRFIQWVKEKVLEIIDKFKNNAEIIVKKAEEKAKDIRQHASDAPLFEGPDIEGAFNEEVRLYRAVELSTSSASEAFGKKKQYKISDIPKVVETMKKISTHVEQLTSVAAQKARSLQECQAKLEALSHKMESSDEEQKKQYQEEAAKVNKEIEKLTSSGRLLVVHIRDLRTILSLGVGVINKAHASAKGAHSDIKTGEVKKDQNDKDKE
jgi:uncharacterized phage infection (PIP) family protein YhgE